MNPFRWLPDKRELLKQERGVSFDDIAVAAEAGAFLKIASHQNTSKFPRQKIMVVDLSLEQFWRSNK